MPNFDQGSLFYDSVVKDALKGLQSLQNKCLCIIAGKKEWIGTEATHNKLKLLSVVNRRNMHLLKYADKLSFRQANLLEQHHRTLRSNRRILLKEPRSHCKQFDRSFVIKSVI